MSIFEFDEELYKKSIREEGYEEGYEKGKEQGRVESQEIIDSLRIEIEDLKKRIEEKQCYEFTLKQKIINKDIFFIYIII